MSSEDLGLRIRSPMIACGASHTVYLRGETVHAIGDNKKGQLGSAGPGPVSGLPCSIEAVECGLLHSIAATADTVYSWGSNASGQRGAEQPESGTPNKLPLGDVQVRAIGCGALSTTVACYANEGHHGIAAGLYRVWTVGYDCSTGDNSAVPRPVLHSPHSLHSLSLKISHSFVHLQEAAVVRSQHSTASRSSYWHADGTTPSQWQTTAGRP